MRYTFDTGALIALERRKERVRKFYETASRITVPSVVIAEWWRGRTDRREDILLSVDIEERLSEASARLVGEVLGRLKPRQSENANLLAIDAIVMAGAAERGDIVLTSDYSDLARLQNWFPVDILSV